MLMKIIISTVLIVGVLFGLKSHVMAEGKSADYKQFVKDAFHTQVALSEKERSLNEIKDMLNTYFTKDFTSLFLKENLVKTDKGYQTFGSDFPLYYIPFFSYDDQTKVKKLGNRVYIFENMAKKDTGPVFYKSDYQGVRLKKVKGVWKIDEILYYVPKNIIQSPKATMKHPTHHGLKSLKNSFLNPLTSIILPINIKPIWLLMSKF